MRCCKGQVLCATGRGFMGAKKDVWEGRAPPRFEKLPAATIVPFPALLSLVETS